MERSNLLFAWVVALAAATVAAEGCQAIAGIETRTTDPLLTGCTLPGVAGTAATGAGRIRLVNLGTSAATGNADFCVRPTGTTSWGRPIFRDGGNDALCSGGLRYQQSTVPFSVPVGKIDVKAIPAGQTCAANATSELGAIAVGSSVPVTILRWGTAANEALAALPEELTPRPSDGSQYRLVNALAAAEPINIGLTVTPFVPTTLTSVAYAQPIAPGAAEPASTGQLGMVDANGYLQIISEAFQFGAALASDSANDAIVVFDTNSADTATMYVTGNPADNTHPVQGLYCSEVGSIAGAIETGADAGAAASGVALTPEDEALLAVCTPTQLPLISIDTFNVGLYGGDAPFPHDRAPAIYAAIAERNSDVMCVVEADEQADRTNIANRAMAWFPNSYSFAADLDTAPTLAADAPSPAANAPCASSVVPSSVLCSSSGYQPPCVYVSPGGTPATTSIYGCMGAKCSSIPNDSALAGTILTDTCVSQLCVTPFLSIYGSTVPLDNCYDCVVYYFTSELPISDGLSACSTDTRQQFAFAGQIPEMILSHYPLSNEQTYILPSTGFRRAVLKATVTLENNAKFDFFCLQLSAPGNKNKLPYTGNYGSTSASANGWEDEQDLQVQEAVAFIQQQTAADGLPAVIAGDLHSDNGTGDGGPGQLGSVSPEVVGALEAAFVEAVPAGYTRSCDYCPSSQNPYNSTRPLEFLWTFLSGFPANSTQSSTLWGTAGDAVSIAPVSGTGNTSGEVAPPGNVGPLSPYYPRNVTVLRPPPAGP